MSNKAIIVIIVFLVLASLLWFSFALYTWFSKTQTNYRISSTGKIELVATSTDGELVTEGLLKSDFFSQPISSSSTSVKIDQLTVKAQGLVGPKGVAVIPDGRLLIIEKRGVVKLVGLDDKVNDIFTLTDVDSVGEAGLLGIALDPDFVTNRKVYLFYTYHSQGGELFNKVVSYDLVSEIDRVASSSAATSTKLDKVFTPLVFINDQIVIDRIPAGYTNNGGTIAFGPDNNLWILVGDVGRAILAQDNQSLAGKILRVTNKGQVPADNPNKGSFIYASGLRQPTGITWTKTNQSVTGLVSEVGTNNNDEVNRLTPGSNYGWPVASGCLSGDSRFSDPIICSGTKTWGPTGLGVISASSASSSLVMSMAAGQALIAFDLNRYLSATSSSVDFGTILSGYGRWGGMLSLGDILYAWTNNRDGKNTFKANDDQVIRIDLK